MRQTLFEQASTLQIGTVEFVSPDEIKIAIDIEAPESVALNTGGPRPFPRANGYLLIPVDQGFVVGQVEWITVERSPSTPAPQFKSTRHIACGSQWRGLRLQAR